MLLELLGVALLLGCSSRKSSHETKKKSNYGFQEDVRPYIKQCDCFVLPSYHEGMANTNLESASTGRPVITTNIPGCKEAVIDGQNLRIQRENGIYYEKRGNKDVTPFGIADAFALARCVIGQSFHKAFPLIYFVLDSKYVAVHILKRCKQQRRQAEN